MTLDEMNKIIDRVMNNITGTIGSDANVPQRSGRLRSAIKVRRVADGYQIYMDTGSMSEEEWDETGAALGVAPYAARVEQMKPYWRRVAMAVHDRLRRELGAEFETNYNPRGEE